MPAPGQKGFRGRRRRRTTTPKPAPVELAPAKLPSPRPVGQRPRQAAVDREVEKIEERVEYAHDRALEQQTEPPAKRPGFMDKVRAGADAAKVGRHVWKERRTIGSKLKSSKFWLIVGTNVVLCVLAALEPSLAQKCAQLIAYLNSAYIGGQSLVDAARNFNVGDLAIDSWKKRDVLKEKLGSRKLIITGLSSGILTTLTVTLGLPAETTADLIGMVTGTFLGGQSLAGAAKVAKPKKARSK